MICTPLSRQTTGFIWEARKAKSEKSGYSGWGIIWASEDSLLRAFGLMFMKIKASAQVHTQAVLILMPLCCLTGRTLDNLFATVHETEPQYAFSYTHVRLTLCLWRLLYLPSWDSASTTDENILTELLEEMRGRCYRFAILNHFLDGFRIFTVFRQTVAEDLGMLSTRLIRRSSFDQRVSQWALYGLEREILWLEKEDNPQIQYEWAGFAFLLWLLCFQYSTDFQRLLPAAEKDCP